MKKILPCLILLIFRLQSEAQTVQLTYKESDEDIRNPERGFYIPLGTKAGNFVLLDTAELKNCTPSLTKQKRPATR